MLECIVLAFGIAVNVHTTETYQIYRCEGSSVYKYLDRDDEFKGVYNPSLNMFVISNERKGV